MNSICYCLLYIEREKIDGKKTATTKPWPPKEMSARQSYIEMCIESQIFSGKKHGA